LLVLYVVTTPPIVSSAAAATGAAMVQSRHETAAELRALVEYSVRTGGVRAEFLSRTGNPYRELLRVAEERRVDAIVVGASSKQGHRFVGSLAGRLVRDAAWPVTVVP
jgi:nucleotide-binding universal stress UspA family protein